MTKAELDLMECLRAERVVIWDSIGKLSGTSDEYLLLWRQTPAADLPQEFMAAREVLDRHRNGRPAY